MAYIGVQPTAGQYRKLDNISASFNGSTTSFTTSVGGTNVTAGTAQQLIVSLGGVIQQPDTDYTVSTNTITFTTAPTSGLDFFAILMGDALNTVTPSDGSVTTSKLAGSLSVGLTAGSASTPALFFTGDTNNGIFSPSTDAIAVTTAGSERLRIDSSGRVGIGTTDVGSYNTYGNKLVVYGTGTNGPGMTIATGTTDTGSIYFADGTTGDQTYRGSVQYSHSTDALIFGTAANERARIDSAGRWLLGTSSARSNFYNSTATAQYQLEGTDSEKSAIAAIHVGANVGGPRVVLAKGRGGSIGSNTVVQNGDTLGQITFQGNDGTEFVEAATIEAYVDGTPGANDMPGRLVFSTTADGASSPSTAMTINQNRTLTCEADIFVKGGLFVSDPITTNRYLYKASSGGGTATVYIGNAAIQVSSDARLKDNIQDTSLSAVEELQKVRVVDFTWNDPSDTSYNNRNARGIWTGVIAQELIDVFPFAVNAPRKEDDLSIDHDSDSTWTVEQQQLVPVLIKAIQEQQAVITNLQDRLSALEAK